MPVAKYTVTYKLRYDLTCFTYLCPVLFDHEVSYLILLHNLLQSHMYYQVVGNSMRRMKIRIKSDKDRDISNYNIESFLNSIFRSL